MRRWRFDRQIIIVRRTSKADNTDAAMMAASCGVVRPDMRCGGTFVLDVRIIGEVDDATVAVFVLVPFSVRFLGTALLVGIVAMVIATVCDEGGGGIPLVAPGTNPSPPNRVFQYFANP